MDSLYAFKGKSKPVMSLHRPDFQVDLVSYADGSMGIVRDGKTLGVWEHNDHEACLAEFVQLAGGKERFNETVVLLRKKGPVNRCVTDPPLLN